MSLETIVGVDSFQEPKKGNPYTGDKREIKRDRPMKKEVLLYRPSRKQDLADATCDPLLSIY